MTEEERKLWTERTLELAKQGKEIARAGVDFATKIAKTPGPLTTDDLAYINALETSVVALIKATEAANRKGKA